jgi:hypothetical protein
MSIDTSYLSALQTFGYTEEESRFLYLVTTHSGYFVSRQFLAFVGADWGKRTTSFWNKLRANKHARNGRLWGRSLVYHVYARRLYNHLGQENLRNRRRHELEYIERRVAILDFVLSNPRLPYLETEDEKVAFFCGELKIEPRHLPSKTYLSNTGAQPTVRYFVDRFPMFFEDSQADTRVITFSFIQGSDKTLAALIHHLESYAPLFRELREFHFLYLARTDIHFAKARELFRALVAVPLESNPADDLLRYFSVRKAWELRQYGAVTEDDLVFRNLSKERFAGERFEHFYRTWKAGRVSDSHIRAAFQGHAIPHITHFETRILTPFSPGGEDEGANR